MKEVSDLEGLVKEIKTLRDINGDLQRWLKQTEDMLKFQQEENKKLREENERLKSENNVKKVNEFCDGELFEERIKDNTLTRDFSKQRIKELEEDIHMLRVENDILRKQLRGEY